MVKLAKQRVDQPRVPGARRRRAATRRGSKRLVCEHHPQLAPQRFLEMPMDDQSGRNLLAKAPRDPPQSRETE
jgi:hypothetical protein